MPTGIPGVSLCSPCPQQGEGAGIWLLKPQRHPGLSVMDSDVAPALSSPHPMPAVSCSLQRPHWAPGAGTMRMLRGEGVTNPLCSYRAPHFWDSFGTRPLLVCCEQESSHPPREGAFAGVLVPAGLFWLSPVVSKRSPSLWLSEPSACMEFPFSWHGGELGRGDALLPPWLGGGSCPT